MTNTTYWNGLVEWDARLAGAPGGVLVFLACLAVGYLLRIVRPFPNRFIPLSVTIAGAIAYSLVTWVSGQAGPVWVRACLIGLVIGFVAWLCHRLLIKHLENFLKRRFGVQIEEDGSDPTAFKK